MRVLITGSAGFIGFHLARKLLERGELVVGIDSLNDYYSVLLKKDRLKELARFKNFTFFQMDLLDYSQLDTLFSHNNFSTCINLAGQPGVGYSMEKPHSYIDANIKGFLNILELCRHHKVLNVIYASSSSVFGANEKYPYSESDNISHPRSLYAATKHANELMAHTYSSLYELNTTGLRFFTVYGPWGRPDMAAFKFVHNIIANKPIDVYHNGEIYRDFTYIDDIIAGILLVMDNPAKPDPNWNPLTPDKATSYAPYRIYNIGRGRPIRLIDFISTLESCLNKKAKINYLPMQPGDVLKTFADISRLQSDYGYQPKTELKQGVENFIGWYLDYFAKT